MPFSSLYKKTFGEHADLEKIAGDHPYFSLVHFFRLQQTQPGADDYNEIAAKTSLHFANPFLLNRQLNEEEIKAGNLPAAALEQVEIETPVHSTHEETATESSDHMVEVIEEPVVANVTEEVKTPVTLETEIVKAENVVKEIKHTHPPLLFEPLHTTDYFASQGIKLSEIVQPGDRMGRQMKSFTEWLKTMKKVHPDGLKEKNEGFIDPSVQKMAEKSNKEEEVITESMAEVYLQQGKTNKAKEIYEKLSLLNPSKSAFFAAKLNEIQ